MGKFIIVVSTILVIFTIEGINRINDKQIIQRVKDTLYEINNTYKKLFSKEGKIVSRTYALIFIVSEILATVTILKIGINSIAKDESLIYFIAIISAILILLILIHLFIGYILMITSGIQAFIFNVENRNLKKNLIMSYFILSTYFTVFIFDASQFEGVHLIALTGLLISYILNLKVLVKIIKNPSHAKSKNKDNNIISEIVVISILLLIMIVLNLFLATCIINQIYPNSYTNNPTSFDLFYYTIITFTTIGYGDIYPVTIPAKIIAIVIAFTSVVCITIFLSTVLSYRDE